MSKVIELLSFLPKGGTAKRDLDERTAELALSVKDFGAKGDGSDDTVAIQACFDVAFGPYTSPHGGFGGAGLYLNRPVYFPPGNYVVSSQLAEKAVTNVTAGTSNGAGGNFPRVTVTSTSGLTNGDVVYIRGVTSALGAGLHEVNGSWGIFNITATTFEIQTIAFVNAYVSGGTVRTPALRLRSVLGGHIFGGGRLATSLTLNNFNSALISTNGMGFSKIENISFGAPTGSIAFDLMWDNTGTQSSQSNTFQNCNFGGTGSTFCEIGLAIGQGYAMGSENMILNCYIAGATVAGVYATNQNALQNSIIGGNIGSCRRGVYAQGGSFPNIQGVGFQNYQVTPHVDIEIANGTISDCYYISGCRSESDNFLKTPGGAPFHFHVAACSQTGANSGFFVSGSGNISISNCYSLNGYVEGTNASVTIDNSTFVRGADYLTVGSDAYQHLHVHPQRILTQTGTTYTLNGTEDNAKTIFTNSSPITVSIPKNSDGSIRMFPGSKLYVQQGGTGKVTFAGLSGVTINSRGGLKSLNGQWACGTLTCDALDTWTLEGDIVA